MYVGLVSLILNLQKAMLSPQFHLSYDDFLKTVHPTSGNPPIYSNWQALTDLSKHERPVRDTNSAAPKRVDYSVAIITRDAPIPPSENTEIEIPCGGPYCDIRRDASIRGRYSPYDA